MSTESDSPRLEDLLENIKTHLDDLEAELETEVSQGQSRLTELAGDVRDRVDAFRGREPESEPTRIEQLRQDIEALETEIEAELDSGTKRITAILDNVRDQVRRLENRLR